MHWEDPRAFGQGYMVHKAPNRYVDLGSSSWERYRSMKGWDEVAFRVQTQSCSLDPPEASKKLALSRCLSHSIALSRDC